MDRDTFIANIIILGAKNATCEYSHNQAIRLNHICNMSYVIPVPNGKDIYVEIVEEDPFDKKPVRIGIYSESYSSLTHKIWVNYAESMEAIDKYLKELS